MSLASESLLPAPDIYMIRSRRDSLCRVSQCQPGEWMGWSCGSCILGRTRYSRLNFATDGIVLRNKQTKVVEWDPRRLPKRGSLGAPRGRLGSGATWHRTLNI